MFNKCGNPHCRTGFDGSRGGSFFVTDRPDGLDARAMQVQVGRSGRVILYFFWLCDDCCAATGAADEASSVEHVLPSALP